MKSNKINYTIGPSYKDLYLNWCIKYNKIPNKVCDPMEDCLCEYCNHDWDHDTSSGSTPEEIKQTYMNKYEMEENNSYFAHDLNNFVLFNNIKEFSQIIYTGHYEDLFYIEDDDFGDIGLVSIIYAIENNHYNMLCCILRLGSKEEINKLINFIYYDDPDEYIRFNGLETKEEIQKYFNNYFHSTISELICLNNYDISMLLEILRYNYSNESQFSKIILLLLHNEDSNYLNQSLNIILDYMHLINPLGLKREINDIREEIFIKFAILPNNILKKLILYGLCIFDSIVFVNASYLELDYMDILECLIINHKIFKNYENQIKIIEECMIERFRKFYYEYKLKEFLIHKVIWHPRNINFIMNRV